MKTIETSTNLIPCLDVGTYNGYCESDYVLSSSLDELSIEMQNKYWELFDNGKYMNMLFRQSKLHIESDIKDFLIGLGLGIKDVKAIKIHSPREYNFETDQVYFNLTVTNDFEKRLVKWLKDNGNNEALHKFLIDRYKSYDGFMSFTPCTVFDLILSMRGDVARCSGAVLSYLIQDEIECRQESFLEDVNNNAWYSDFLPDSEAGDRFMHRCNVHLTINQVI